MLTSCGLAQANDWPTLGVGQFMGRSRVYATCAEYANQRWPAGIPATGAACCGPGRGWAARR